MVRLDPTRTRWSSPLDVAPLDGRTTPARTPKASSPVRSTPAPQAFAPAPIADATRADARRMMAGGFGARFTAHRLNAALDARATAPTLTLASATRAVRANFDTIAGAGGFVRREDLARVANDPAASPELRAAARFFTNSPTAFSALDVGAGKGDADGKVSKKDVEALDGRLAGDPLEGPTAGVDGAVDTRAEADRVIDRYLPLADTAAGKGGRDGDVSRDDLRALLDDPSTPAELRGAADYYLRYGIERGDPGGGGLLDTITSPFSAAKDFFDHPGLSDDRRRELFDAADRARSADATSGVLDQPLNRQQNAHRTNTPEEMLAALDDGRYAWLEGDVRREGLIDVPGRHERAIMGHDPNATDGMSLREWLEIGGRSGKNLKLDIKQAGAVDEVIAEVKRSGIPTDRIMFNADVMDGPGAGSGLGRDVFDSATDTPLSLDDLKKIRAAFPDARISIGARTGAGAEPARYTDAQIDEMIRDARALGGPVLFPLRAEYVTPEIIRRLEPYGDVSIWNDPASYPLATDADAARRADQFRAWGATGVIDLRTTAEG